MVSIVRQLSSALFSLRPTFSKSSAKLADGIDEQVQEIHLSVELTDCVFDNLDDVLQFGNGDNQTEIEDNEEYKEEVEEKLDQDTQQEAEESSEINAAGLNLESVTEALDHSAANGEAVADELEKESSDLTADVANKDAEAVAEQISNEIAPLSSKVERQDDSGSNNQEEEVSQSALRSLGMEECMIDQVPGLPKEEALPAAATHQENVAKAPEPHVDQENQENQKTSQSTLSEPYNAKNDAEPETPELDAAEKNGPTVDTVSEPTGTQSRDGSPHSEQGSSPSKSRAQKKRQRRKNKRTSSQAKLVVESVQSV